MPRARPQSRLDELAFVIRIGVETALLRVGGYFDGEANDPHDEADDGERVQVFARGGRDGYQRGRGGEGDPQALDGPDVEEAQEVRLDLVEAVILASLADAAEEERAETDCPDDDQRCNENRTRIHRDAVAGVAERDANHGDVGDAPCQVEEFFGLENVGGDESQPLNQEGQSDCDCKYRNAAERRATLTSRERDQVADQKQDWKYDQ